MNGLRLTMIALLSLLYWVAALALAFLAIGAPCGFAPESECELHGPTTFGAVLGVLGPFGVIAIAAFVYAVFYGVLNRRLRGG